MTLTECEYCKMKMNRNQLELHQKVKDIKKVAQQVRCFKCIGLRRKDLWCKTRQLNIALDSWFAIYCEDFKKEKEVEK